MKINEVKDSNVSVIAQMGEKSISLKGKRIEVEDDFFDAVKLPPDSVAILTDILHTDDGKAVSVNSEDIEIHVQTVVEGKVYRFTNVRHKRIKVGGEECECFFTSRDALKIEQRKAYRCGVSVPCQVARASDTKAQSATVKDVSITGAALLSMSLDINVGDYVKVRFTDKMKSLKDEESTEVVNINFAATVVRSRPLGKFTEYGLSIKECNGNVLSKYINTKQRLQMKKNREE